ncbi:MAG TPA: hypothetical protein VJ396_09265 [Acidiferrobacterales bacterium]|nr:hypothetical protein [Acidiferrobacterales bacterium]
MSDIIDEAGEWEEELRDQALRRRKPNGPAATGFCLNEECCEVLLVGRRWCNAEHRDRYYRQLQVRLDKMGRYYDEENNDN